MEYKYLSIHKSNHVAVCTISNPPNHTISDGGVVELLDIVEKTEADKDTRVLVLTGGHKDIFIAHYEVAELAQISKEQRGKEKEQKLRKLHNMNRLCLNLENSRLITIAALNGAAAGGGWELALACDFRLAKNGKHMYGLPETNVGVIPGAGGTQRMPRLIGTAMSLDLILHGRVFSPEKALEMGLVHRVYDPEYFADEWQKFAQDLAKRSPLALIAAKKAIQQGIQKSNMEESLLHEQDCFDTVISSEDAAGALKAFLKSKKYEWKGR